MSSITYGAVLLLLVFITPALPLWALFRISIPKGRAILSTEWSIAIFGCLLSWFINGHHIAAYTHALLTSLAAGGTDIGAHGAAVMLMIGDHSAKDPETLLQTVSSWLFNWRSADLSFSNLVFTLHLRSFTFGLAGLLCLKGLFRFEKNAQLIPYKEGFPEKFSLWDKARILLCGISPIKIVGQGKYESKVIRHPLARFFQELILHPWSLLTLWNPEREVLMVDVSTTDDNIYSGTLSTWVSNKDEISSIAMEYVLRFYPGGPNAGRQKSLIKNNGELILPSGQIKSIHFWELRKDTKTTISITKSNDIERLKWTLVLHRIHPAFLSSITVIVKLEGQEKKEFLRDLDGWAKENSLSELIRKMKFIYLRRQHL